VSADLLVSRQRGQDADKRHCRRGLALSCSFKLCLERFKRRYWQRGGLLTACRKETAQRVSPLEHVLEFSTVGCWLVVRNVGDILVRDRNIEAITKTLDLFDIEFLLLMSRVLSFTGRSHTEALDGFRQDNRRSALVSGRRVVRCIHFL